MTLVDAVGRTLRRHAMLEGGEAVLVAVSGGADSVALFLALQSLAPALRLELHVVHVDHRLRPDSARAAAFVEDLARRLGVPVEVLPIDVPGGDSLEAAARAARYTALEACADRIGADRIATGHTADDQAETVLMRVIEGAGPRGLAGIPPVRARIVRPLIETRRAAIVAYLRELGQSWVEDPSNRDRRFLRNQVRHDLLPGLAAVAPDVVSALNRTARLAHATVDALDRTAAAALERWATDDGPTVTLPLAALRDLPPEIAAEALRLAACRLGGRAALRAWAHRGLRRVLTDPAPRRAFTLGGVRVEVSSGRIRLAARPAPTLSPRNLTIPGSVDLHEIGVRLCARVVDARGYELPRDRRRVAFDAAVLPPSLTVRARHPGDRFAPFGGAEQRLKAFLINAKVPRWERDATPLVEGAGEIVWVAGLRRGAAAPITAGTCHVVELALWPLAESPGDR